MYHICAHVHSCSPPRRRTRRPDAACRARRLERKVESPELLVGRDFIVMIARCLTARAPPRDNILAARWYAQPIPCAPPRMSRGAILSADSSSLPQTVRSTVVLAGRSGQRQAPARRSVHRAGRQDPRLLLQRAGGCTRRAPPGSGPLTRTFPSRHAVLLHPADPRAALMRALLPPKVVPRLRPGDAYPTGALLQRRCARRARAVALPGLLPRHLCARLTAGHRASFIAQDCYEESDGGEAWEVVYVPSDVSREQVRVGGNARGTLSVRLEVGLPCWHAPAVAVAVSLLCACGSGESDRDLTLAVAAPATHSRRRSTSPRRTAGGRGLRLARRPPRR